MGRRTDGSSVRGKLVAIRLNDEEAEDLERKKKRRGLRDTSAYYRKLQQEDQG
jgi:trehalose-6-phosphatase